MEVRKVDEKNGEGEGRVSGHIMHMGIVLSMKFQENSENSFSWRDTRNWKGSCYLPVPIPQLTPLALLTPWAQQGTARYQPGRGEEMGARGGKGDWRGTAQQESTGCRGWSTFLALEPREELTVCVCRQWLKKATKPENTRQD